MGCWGDGQLVRGELEEPPEMFLVACLRFKVMLEKSKLRKQGTGSGGAEQSNSSITKQTVLEMMPVPGPFFAQC